jgi:hypothetical protein
VIHGACLKVMRGLPDCSVDAVVTDPPYGIGFMGRVWDSTTPGADVWVEVLRVLKPGGHLLCFAGTRTHHRMASAIEEAGFEIRDMIAWVYGSGMPKSHDVSKAIDKAKGATREVVGARTLTGSAALSTAEKGGTFAPNTSSAGRSVEVPVTAPSTPEAKQWSGFGTALKPAMEPITVARKPLEGTVAANVLKHGTGAINVDGGRVSVDAGDPVLTSTYTCRESAIRPGSVGFMSSNHDGKRIPTAPPPLGRWPANLIHDGSPEVLSLFPDSKGMSGGGKHKPGAKGGMFGAIDSTATARGDNGSAARFFYCSKASKKDRNDGAISNHPTVKPTDLMRYLCRLVTPPGGLILDPFCGSGSTGRGAVLEGFSFLGIEVEAEYVEIARARIAACTSEAAE